MWNGDILHSIIEETISGRFFKKRGQINNLLFQTLVGKLNEGLVTCLTQNMIGLLMFLFIMGVHQ